MTEILFLGGLFPKETEDEIISKSIGNLQNAANNLQWELVKGLDENLSTSVTIVNSLFIGSFPKRYKSFKIRTYDFSFQLEHAKAINVGFTNLTGIKRFSRYYGVKTQLDKWIKEKKSSKKVVIAYAMTSIFTQLLEYAKKIDDKIITCLIVPDLPQYMNLSNKKNGLYNVLKNAEIGIIKKNMGFIDCYVVLTRHMVEYLDIAKPSVVIEGVASNKVCTPTVHYDHSKNSSKMILYTGGLNERYGVLELVKNFRMLENDNCVLVLCGFGDAENKIREISEVDKRVVYKGLLKREEILALQKEATVLINPRPNNEEYTKFSFPSKIIEYMASGRPVVAFMLDGIPGEYREYFYEINPRKKNAIYETLKIIMETDEKELTQKGKEARDFVLNQKNRQIQVDKILSMISDL